MQSGADEWVGKDDMPKLYISWKIYCWAYSEELYDCHHFDGVLLEEFS